MGWISQRLMPPGNLPPMTRWLVAVMLVSIAGLMLLAGSTKLALAAEGPTQPPEHWQWDKDWPWEDYDWSWPPVGGWYRDAEGRYVDRESGKPWREAPFYVLPNGRVIDRETLQPPPQSGVSSNALINVVHESMKRWIPISPLGLVLLVAFIELGLGLGLLLGVRRKPIVAICVAIVVAVFSLVMLLASPELAGEDCGCFGGLLDFDNLWLNLGRNAAIVTVSIAIAFAWLPPKARAN